jgi:hypothetical protein
MTISGEWVRIWREVVVTYFKIGWYPDIGMDTDNYFEVRIALTWPIFERTPPEYKSGSYCYKLLRSYNWYHMAELEKPEMRTSFR